MDKLPDAAGVLRDRFAFSPLAWEMIPMDWPINLFAESGSARAVRIFELERLCPFRIHSCSSTENKGSLSDL